MTRTRILRYAAFAALALPALAQAHPGHENDSTFVIGLVHPLGAPDHLFALLAAGLLAGRIGGRALWLLPAAVLALSGVAHGEWIAPSADGWLFCAGLMSTSALLVGTGAAVTTRYSRLTTAAAPR